MTLLGVSVRKRTLHAAMLSPLVAIPVFGVGFAIFYLFLKGPDDIVDSWIWLLIFLVYVLPIAYIASFLVGIPIDLFLRRIGLRSPVTYALLGFVFGGAIGVSMFEPSYLSANMAVCGLAIGLCFGLISNTECDEIF
jgi:hypothetical protein